MKSDLPREQLTDCWCYFWICPSHGLYRWLDTGITYLYEDCLEFSTLVNVPLFSPQLLVIIFGWEGWGEGQNQVAMVSTCNNKVASLSLSISSFLIYLLYIGLAFHKCTSACIEEDVGSRHFCIAPLSSPESHIHSFIQPLQCLLSRCFIDSCSCSLQKVVHFWEHVGFMWLSNKTFCFVLSVTSKFKTVCVWGIGFVLYQTLEASESLRISFHFTRLMYMFTPGF